MSFGFEKLKELLADFCSCHYEIEFLSFCIDKKVQMDCRLALMEPISAQRSGAIKATAGIWKINLPKVSLLIIRKE
jgi:hypothetical protein